jgi:chromosome segregation ATPase
MSDEKTQNLPDTRSFEERIFARFDALDARMARMETRMDRMEARLDDVDTRLQALEAKAYDTKPIWERALAEILEVGKKVDGIDDRMHTLERKFNVLGRDMLDLRGDQSRLEDRMDRVESNRPQ